MGEKKMIKKERKTPSQKKVEAAAAVAPKKRFSWSYYCIPIPLTSCPNLSNNISVDTRRYVSGFGGITKSWILSCCIHQQPRQTWPQLIETNISPKYTNVLNWDTRIPVRFLACSPLGTCKNPMVITGISSPAFAFHGGDYTYYYPWRMRDCRIAEPYSVDNRPMEFTNVVGLQGKYYTISRQGTLALIEAEGSSGNYEITALGRNRAVPCCRVSKHFREHLLEYKGEIYLVFLLSRASVDVVNDVEVFQLDRSRLVWEKVDHLIGDAMFFVQDNCCMGISASLLRCRKGSNCVYFTHKRAKGNWFVYDMKSSGISTSSGPEIDLPISGSSRVMVLDI